MADPSIHARPEETALTEHRCFDCFADISEDAPRFAVLKQTRDVEIAPDATEPASFFYSQAYEPVCVCADCAGWYGDDALMMTRG